ncbi:hypothetical protein DESC_300059 [Desulfosarcina cetonica]|nr:hypothetical protein DESC_300059 [Desulfosarcina cetonica]
MANPGKKNALARILPACEVGTSGLQHFRADPFGRQRLGTDTAGSADQHRSRPGERSGEDDRGDATVPAHDRAFLGSVDPDHADLLYPDRDCLFVVAAGHGNEPAATESSGDRPLPLSDVLHHDAGMEPDQPGGLAAPAEQTDRSDAGIGTRPGSDP